MKVAQERFRKTNPSGKSNWKPGTQKICKHCKKSFTEVSPGQRYCSRSCIKNAWYYRPGNQEKAAAGETRRRIAIRLEIFNHYGDGKCQCCGESHQEFLTIDHVNGGGTLERAKLGKQGKQFYMWLKRQGYPSGYRVLCMNCNHSIGLQGYCPHQKGE